MSLISELPEMVAIPVEGYLYSIVKLFECCIRRNGKGSFDVFFDLLVVQWEELDFEDVVLEVLCAGSR